MAQKTLIVRVRRIVPKSEIHPEDMSANRKDGVSGKYSILVENGDIRDMAESALDVFHSRIGIKVLDNYEITVRLPSKKEKLGEGCAIL